MSLRSISFVIALLCFAGLRVVGVMPGTAQELTFAGPPLGHHAALLLACESLPERLTLPQTTSPLGLTDFSMPLTGAMRGAFCPVRWIAEVGVGKRVWRAVSRGPPVAGGAMSEV
jgi:hypothetical protein